MLAFYLSLLDTEERRDKFAFLYRQYKGLMYHVALSVVKEHFLAEDVIHETFLNLIRIMDEVRISDPKETRKFLRILTHHQAVDQLRKLHRAEPWSNDAIEGKMTQESPDPAAVAINRQDFDRLVAHVEGMDDLYRAPLSLRIQGYKIQEIAEILKMNPQTVKVRLHRARKMLLAQLEDEPHGNKQG